MSLLLILHFWIGPSAFAGISPLRERELKNIVEQDCGSCHGLTRKGGLGTPLLKERMRTFPPEGLKHTILNGIPGTAMPPWRELLNDEEVEWIVHELRGD